MSSVGQKRKQQDRSHPSSSKDRKRQKRQDAVSIRTQKADAALSEAGELNIASFIKSREFEINSLDKSMKKCRQVLSSRAFQQVPRHLRRRTASHNAKKVPRRLRSRARREMAEDNTPTRTRKPGSHLRLRLETAKALKKLTRERKTVRQKKREAKANAAESDPSKHINVVQIPRIKKNKLADPPLATSKYKRRQVSKTWLPTHLWHTKRAHMTQPTEPLWRMTIPLRPTEKCYRATHRATESRGCVAWDMSYMSTIGCLGTSIALEGMLKAIGFHGNGWIGPKYKKWRAGSRFASGWVGSNNGKEALALVVVQWCPSIEPQRTGTAEPADTIKDVEMDGEGSKPKRQKTKLDHRLFIQIHPSAFLEFWSELLKAAKMQKPQVLVEDLRFEIGSIDIMGPASTEALTSTLRLTKAEGNPHQLWDTLASLSNPALLPQNAILNLNVQDPRLQKYVSSSSAPKIKVDEPTLQETMVEWPLDNAIQPSLLFSHKARFTASKLPSQWALNRRRQAILPGESLKASKTDPAIPVILLAHRPTKVSGSQQGYWTLLAPWACIDIIWRKLLYCTLSTGSKPRFGGLRETQQVAFEQRAPWYPGDFHGTEAGKAWERSEAKKRFDEWIRHPPSRRIAWDRIDLGFGRRGELGRGWACDWEYLFRDTTSRARQPNLDAGTKSIKDTEPVPTSSVLLTQRQRKAEIAKVEAERDRKTRERNTSSPESDDEVGSMSGETLPFFHLTPMTARSILQRNTTLHQSLRPALATVRITFIGRGTPNSAARIYRIPAVKPLDDLGVATTNEGQASISEPSLISDTPPAAQRTPPVISKSHIGAKEIRSQPNLRDRWLSLAAETGSSDSNVRVKKVKPNHWGLPRHERHHEAESLRHINVLPKNATAEIRKQYGPKPLTEEEKKVSMEKERVIRMEEEKVWDIHIPCPDAEDLVGFVTNGGYNLAEGRGTAIGCLWVQRVIMGWESAPNSITKSLVSPMNLQAKTKTKQYRTANQSEERERHLCIVRNAGESIGRLAVWELCE